MSKIEQLIKEKCPNGVEYKKIWEVTTWDKKYKSAEKYMQPKTNKYKYLLANQINDILDENGDVFVLETGINVEKKYTTEQLAKDYLCEGEIVAIPWGGTPNVKYYNGKFVTGDNRIATSNDTTVLLNKFLYYFLDNKIKTIAKFYRGSGIKHPEMKKVLMLNIPLPPIKVQEEIVRILDKFSELETELETELEARKRQYEFYKNKIFKFENRKDVKWLKLKEIAIEMYRGNGIKRKEITNEGVPCVRYGEIYTSYNIWFQKCISHTNVDVVPNPKTFTTNDLLFAITGENIEDIAKTVAYVGKGTCYAGGDIVVLKHKQNGKYLSYALSTRNAMLQKGKGKVKSKVVHSSVPSIQEIVIPIVKLEEQERIVKILDKFDKLVNDISEGIPAEIEARKKQYEYYRNKLLSFEELKTND